MTATLQDVITVMNENTADQLTVQLETAAFLENINSNFDKFFIKMELMQMQMLEALRESGGGASPTGTPPGSPPSPAGATGKLGFLAAVTASLAGLAVGFVSGIVDSLKVVGKLLKLDKLAEPIIKFFDKIFSGPRSKLISVFDDIVTKSYVVIDDYIIKPMKSFGNKIKMFFKPVGEFFEKVKKFLDPDGILSKVFSKVGKIFTPISEGASNIGKIFQKFGTTFSKFFSVAKALGGVVGKLFIPIGIIMGIIDTIKGAIAGFTEQDGDMVDKIIGGSFGAIKGLLNGLIMMPLDLLKDGISWIAEKIGFAGFSETLDSFSFEEIFTTMIDGLKDSLLGFIGTFRNEAGKFDFKSVAVGLMGNILNAITLPIRSLLLGVAASAENIPVFGAKAAESLRSLADTMKIDLPSTAASADTDVATKPLTSIDINDTVSSSKKEVEVDNTIRQTSRSRSTERNISSAVSTMSKEEKLELKQTILGKRSSGVNLSTEELSQVKILTKEGIITPEEYLVAAKNNITPLATRQAQSAELEQVSGQNADMKAKSAASSNIINAPSSSTVNNSSTNTQIISQPMPSSRNRNDGYSGLVGTG